MSPELRRRLLLFFTAGLFALFLGDRLLFTPLLNRWTERGEAIAELELTLEQDQALLDREEVITRRWAEMQERSLPASEATSEGTLLRSVAGWAAESGAEVTAIKPSWKPATEDAVMLDCQVSVQGSMQSLAKFLHALEVSALPLRTEDIYYAPQGEKADRLGLELRFTALALPKEQKP